MWQRGLGGLMPAKDRRCMCVGTRGGGGKCWKQPPPPQKKTQRNAHTHTTRFGNSYLMPWNPQVDPFARLQRVMKLRTGCWL